MCVCVFVFHPTTTTTTVEEEGEIRGIDLVQIRHVRAVVVVVVVVVHWTKKVLLHPQLLVRAPPKTGI